MRKESKVAMSNNLIAETARAYDSDGSCDGQGLSLTAATPRVARSRFLVKGERFFDYPQQRRLLAGPSSHPERASRAGVARQHSPESTRAAHGLTVGARARIGGRGSSGLLPTIQRELCLKVGVWRGVRRQGGRESYGL